MTVRALILSLLFTCALPVLAQEGAVGVASLGDDPDFKPKIEKPAYTGKGPRVLFSHRLTGLHFEEGFLKVVRADGYRVRETTQPVTHELLSSTDILVIVEPGEFTHQETPDSVISEVEATLVHDWVMQGGSLLIASHGPGCDALLRRFNTDASHGQVIADKPPLEDEDPTFLAFKAETKTIANHIIIQGAADHPVSKVVAMAPQTFAVPDGAVALLSFPPGTLEDRTSNEEMINAMKQVLANPSSAQSTEISGVPNRAIVIPLPSHPPQPTEGRAAAVVFTAGQGRVLLIGDPGMISAQVTYVPAGDLLQCGRSKDAK